MTLFLRPSWHAGQLALHEGYPFMLVKAELNLDRDRGNHLAFRVKRFDQEGVIAFPHVLGIQIPGYLPGAAAERKPQIG